jgi:CelD/BcsL family acetyltransferase involved in cellulose biosynthesis
LIPWCDNFSGQGEVCALAFWQEGKLAGIAPWQIVTEAETGERQLVLLGTGITDYLDVLVDPEFAGSCETEIRRWLAENRHRWTVADFQQLKSGAFLLEMPTSDDVITDIAAQEVCPVLDLPASLEDLPRYVPVNMLTKLNVARRKLRKLGQVRIEQAGPEDFESKYETLLRLHAARWGLKHANGVLAAPEVRAFHRNAASSMLASDCLRLHELSVGRQPVASLYAFRGPGAVYFYLGGFDPGFAAYSPGMILLGEAIEAAVRERAASFDFLRGRETYKYMWGAKGRINHRVRIWSASDRPLTLRQNGGLL